MIVCFVDETARKLAALQHSNSVIIKQAAAGKEGALSATSAAVAAERGGDQHVQWVAAPKFVHTTRGVDLLVALDFVK
jgi:hypothetical protein